MGVPEGVGFIHETAVIGEPGEWREYIQRDHPYPPEEFQPVIDPSARVGATVTVNSGCYRATIVGANVWLMNGVHISHDCWVYNDTEIAPNASVGGCCTIGRGVKIGMGAVILPKLTVGDNAVIGAGAVVTKDVPAGEVWVGNPARKLRDVRTVEPDRRVPLHDGYWEGRDLEVLREANAIA